MSWEAVTLLATRQYWCGGHKWQVLVILHHLTKGEPWMGRKGLELWPLEHLFWVGTPRIWLNFSSGLLCPTPGQRSPSSISTSRESTYLPSSSNGIYLICTVMPFVPWHDLCLSLLGHKLRGILVTVCPTEINVSSTECNFYMKP